VFINKVFSRVGSIVILFALTTTVLTVDAIAAPDSLRRANASRGRQQQAARARSQAQARQRAQAQARQRAQAQARQRAQAQAQARQRAQAQAAQRAKAQAAQRAKAQAAKRAQAQAKQRARAQAQAKQRAAPSQSRKPSRPARNAEKRARDAERLQQSLSSGAGSVRSGSRPTTRPATERGSGNRGRSDIADGLQNSDRRPGSIGAARRDGRLAEAGSRGVDWDSAGTRFSQEGTDDSGRWEEIRDEHGDLEFSVTRGEFESSSEWSAYGFQVGGGGYGYWYDEEEDLVDWVDDDRPYTPANNEFYAVDAKQPTATDPDAGVVTEPGVVSDLSVLLPGNRVSKLSSKAVLADTSGEAVYFDRGVFFRDHQIGKRFEVVAAPVGAIVPALPKGYRKVTLGGTGYSIYLEVYYRKVYRAGQIVFMVAQVGK